MAVLRSESVFYRHVRSVHHGSVEPTTNALMTRGNSHASMPMATVDIGKACVDMAVTTDRPVTFTSGRCPMWPDDLTPAGRPVTRWNASVSERDQGYGTVHRCMHNTHRRSLTARSTMFYRRSLHRATVQYYIWFVIGADSWTVSAGNQHCDNR
jgi:hypothetical protein